MCTAKSINFLLNIAMRINYFGMLADFRGGKSGKKAIDIIYGVGVKHTSHTCVGADTLSVCGDT